MEMSKTGVVLLMVLCVFSFAFGGDCFPNIEGYKTLVSDFHSHTVFSDGKLWPTVRVDEARREGLDVLAITDHIEYTPFKNDVKVNHNRAYEVALERAKEKYILLIQGSEITRGTPPGHYNATFINDANPLDTSEFLDVIETANKQNACD